MFRGQRILALDIGASSLRMAEFGLLGSGGLELTRYVIGQLGIEPGKEADPSPYIVSTLREIMGEHDIKPGPVLLCVSGKDVFPRYVKLPPVEKDKLLQIIGYEAQQNVPFPIDEVVWDYQLVEGGDERRNVMLVAIKKDVVKRLTDCVESAGLDPEVVDVAPMTLYNVVRYNYASLPACTLVLDVGARTTNLVFIEGERVFTRSIPIAGNAITQELMRDFDLSFKDAEDLKRAQAFVAFGGVYEGSDSQVAETVSKTVRGTMTKLHAEINRSINFYKVQQDGSAPELALLTGGSSVIPQMDTFLTEKLEVPVDYLNPFQNVAVGPDISSEAAAQDFHLLGEVTGLALRKTYRCPMEVNLMPPDLVARRALRKRQPMFVVAAVAVILTVFCWATYFHRRGRWTEARLSEVAARVGDMREAQLDLDKLKDRETAVRERAAALVAPVLRRSRWLEIVADIHDRMKPGMWLISLEPERAEAASAPGRRRVSGAPGAIIEVKLRGMGFADKVRHEDISAFRDALAGGRHFAGGVRIVSMGPFSGGDFANEFVISVPLKEELGTD